MTGPIRLLRVIARLNVGGPAIHVALTSAGLSTRGYRTFVLTGDLGAGEADMEWLARERGVEVAHVPGLGREVGPRDLAVLARVWRRIREFRPHLVHTHTAKAGTLGRLAASLVHPRPLRTHTFHGHVLRGYFSAPKERFFQMLEAGLARMSDRLIVPSERIREELLALRVGRREQYSVIPLGFELEPFLALPGRNGTGPFRRELGVPPGAVLITTVGRLTAIKNHHLLLESFAKVRRRTRSEIHLALVGDGELRHELERFGTEHNLGDRIHFAGWRKEMAPIYAESDIVALSSLNEGTPVTLIEAMASARAVVATGVGGVPDVVTDGVTGLLVDPAREDLLAVALGRLADDPELRQSLASAGREQARRRFALPRLLDELDALYRSLLPMGALET